MDLTIGGFPTPICIGSCVSLVLEAVNLPVRCLKALIRFGIASLRLAVDLAVGCLPALVGLGYGLGKCVALGFVAVDLSVGDLETFVGLGITNCKICAHDVVSKDGGTL